MFIVDNIVIDKGSKPFVLAEVACSHDGSVDKVIDMIKSAANAGFNGIQFQLFSTDLLLAPYHPFYKKVKGLEIKLDDWPPLIKLAQSLGLKVFANVLETSGMKVAVLSQVDAIKVHSADISNPEMLNSVVNSQLPIVLSTGGSTIEEMRIAVEELKSSGVTNLLLMHGFQAYPTDIDNSNLNFITTLEAMFGLLVGYQDHIDAELEISRTLPLLAMAKGGVLLEKHITDCRSRKGTDYESALDLTELSGFIKLINQAWQSFGSSEIRPLSTQEEQYRRNFKKTIVAARRIDKGKKITRDMICFMRADQGYRPIDADKVIGKKCTKVVEKFETFKSHHFDVD